ncbi:MULTISPECIES: PucR family transcriptional regulator [unclassified Streptomyces]|uniref:PucR family transcriptional regulator n=1 Tax=unclassified Streptomyces TaxID=2593676 RepID=UPI0037F92D6B
MGSLFLELSRQAAANARREVEAYAREIPEFEILGRSRRARDETMEYSVWLRRRTIDLSPDNHALSGDDLGYIASIGEARAVAGMSLHSRQRVLRLHTELMLRDINEATVAQRGGGDVDELMRIMTWFAPQGERGIVAYSRGFVTALRRRMPYAEQAALLVRSLLDAEPLAGELATAVGMEVPERCAVTVIRVPGLFMDGDPGLESELEALVKTHQMPVLWDTEGGELIALGPLQQAEPDGSRLSDAVRDFAGALGRPCAAGTASGPSAELGDALEQARRISRAAPLRPASARMRAHTVPDVFVELAVAETPSADDWLRTVARRLDPGPDLFVTLDAYYRHDMQRGAASAALNVHVRTLDYRLRRVRELTGIDPGSTHGVRVLSAVVNRRLSGAWR